MALTIGTQLGSHEITALLGKGGMGEVYRARDLKLKRDVAIKTLPDEFAVDADRLSRFQREAEVLASLSHPNIAAIYDVEEVSGSRYLVLELVEGETLADRLKHGALPVEEALNIAKSIGEALQAAHEKGIVHRDLKPANVKITLDGKVKVLDFGLAKPMDNAPAGTALSNSPTMMSGTLGGIILGTAGYMSPEQARGKPVDKRTDIWAFGVVLYEMLTGQQLFKGDTTSDILAAVLMREPDLSRVPPKVRRLLESCLQKDPNQRLQAIGDWRLVLTDEQTKTVPAPKGKVAWGFATAFAIIAVATYWAPWRTAHVLDQPPMRLSVDLGPDALPGVGTTAVISPNGTRLVYPARGSDGKQMLAARLLDQSSPTVLTGTENASDPFFSSDSQWIGFFDDGKLKKISVEGGTAVTLCDAPNPRGASWGEDDSIIFAGNTTPLLRCPPGVGTPQRLNILTGGEVTHRWPQMLPGGNAVLFTGSATTAGFEGARIGVLSVRTGEEKTLLRGGYFGRYIPIRAQIGELVYISQGVLFGVPFDPVKLELRGTPVPLVEDVRANPNIGSGQFDFSRTGTLVYRTGKEVTQSWPLVSMDKSGNIQPLLAKPSRYSAPQFSPDGLKLALTVGRDQGTTVDIFVYDLQRETTSQITFSKRGNFYPIWSPDGKHIVVRSISSSGASDINWLRADGAVEPQLLLETKNLAIPYSFSPNGNRLAYTELNPDTGTDLWTLPLDLSDEDRPKPGKAEKFLITQHNEQLPAFSPDGHWIAYQSDESGQWEVYVRPFPGADKKLQLSSSGGHFPIWSRNGHELFFETLDNRIMVTKYTEDAVTFNADKPQLWSDKQILSIGTIKNLDLAPDNQHFAVFPLPDTKEEERGTIHITFLLNFFDELRRRVH